MGRWWDACACPPSRFSIFNIIKRGSRPGFLKLWNYNSYIENIAKNPETPKTVPETPGNPQETPRNTPGNPPETRWKPASFPSRIISKSQCHSTSSLRHSGPWVFCYTRIASTAKNSSASSRTLDQPGPWFLFDVICCYNKTEALAHEGRRSPCVTLFSSRSRPVNFRQSPLTL